MEAKVWLALKVGLKMRRYGNIGLWLLACCFVGIASGPAWAATTVYKCFDKTLGVLYTDLPCTGEQMNIRAGDADPVAVAELQREREALSRSAAQRIADNRRAAPEREFVAQAATPSGSRPHVFRRRRLLQGLRLHAVFRRQALHPRKTAVQAVRSGTLLPNPPRGHPGRGR
jgi:hypothetical protein